MLNEIWIDLYIIERKSFQFKINSIPIICQGCLWLGNVFTDCLEGEKETVALLLCALLKPRDLPEEEILQQYMPKTRRKELRESKGFVQVGMAGQCP